MKISASENNMKENQFFDEVLNLKFTERFDVSEKMHQRFLQGNNGGKNKFNSVWIAAAGVIILIFINVLSIHYYKHTLVNEELKEIYGNNWNNINLWQ
jgi:hypothetical protein